MPRSLEILSNVGRSAYRQGEPARIRRLDCKKRCRDQAGDASGKSHGPPAQEVSPVTEGLPELRHLADHRREIDKANPLSDVLPRAPPENRVVDHGAVAELRACAAASCPPSEPDVLGKRFADPRPEPVLEPAQPVQQLLSDEQIRGLVQT